MPSPLSLLVFVRDGLPYIDEAWDELAAFLGGRAGVAICGVIRRDEDPVPTDAAELAIVLGGDGAILRACRKLGQHQLPFVGINLGRLGFLADLSPGDFKRHIHEFEAREFTVVEHLMYECEHREADGRSQRYLGLNEVSIQSGSSLAMIDISLDIAGERVATYSADGLLISTPVGSTAHSLSAGGPILRQDLDAFVITPICPHTLTNRPLVDRADVDYTMQVLDPPPGVMLAIDGQIRCPIAAGDVITVRRAPVRFQLARLVGHSFYGTLHRKLGWGGQVRGPRK
jgi:NAD+ kinase